MQYRFGDYMLDVARRELRHGGEPIAIEPQVFDLLAYLIQNRDRVVTKDDLLGSVWGGRIVSESTLTSRINAARRAIGDSGSTQRFIRTSARKGIRFVAEVVDAQSDKPPSLQAPRDRPSIAVMPFRNLTGDSEQDYFVDGMVEEIVTGLSRIKWLFVISRNSTFIYKGQPIDVRTVGRELGVRYVLEGSVRRSGSQVRVTGQLSETETGAGVWADRYDGEIGEVFALQDLLTMRVIGAVEPNLRKVEIERARRKRPENIDAYDLFLRALPFAATAMPAECRQSAVSAGEGDPPRARLCDRPWFHRMVPRATLSARRPPCRNASGSCCAMHRLRSRRAATMPWHWQWAASSSVWCERDYQTALDALDRSISLSPSSALAFGFSSIIRAWMGDDAAAIAHATMGIRLSPYDPLIYLPNVGLAFAHLFSGNFDEAASAASRASSANPRFSVPRYLHVAALVRLGRQEEAKSIAKVLLEVQPSGYSAEPL